jgi:hypothetical protein
MLTLLLTNSLRLLDRNLQEHAQARPEAAGPLFNASLSARLFGRDPGPIRETLNNLVNGRNAPNGHAMVTAIDQMGRAVGIRTIAGFLEDDQIRLLLCDRDRPQPGLPRSCATAAVDGRGNP